jgi:TonB family protein
MKKLIAAALVASLAPSPAAADPALTRAPAVIAPAEPAYPEAAREAGLAATVTLELLVAVDGQVAEVAVIEVAIARGSELDPAAADPGFAAAAAAAARLMRFSPAEIDGQPAAVKIRYTYRFTLPEPEPEPEPEPAPIAGPAEEAPPPPRPAPRNFIGRVVERGTRRPLPGVVVTVFRGEGEAATGFEAITGEDGGFELFDLPAGEWRVLAEGDGYFPYRTREVVADGEAIEVVYHVERGSYNPYDVTVEAERPRKEVTRRRLSGADITRVAGTLGDPVQVVENLPGVARPSPGSGDIIVRGSGPEDTGIFIDGVSVPQIYHFGGLRSVIPAAVVEGVDLYPGNFSTRYGRYTGGIFEAQIKDLAPERLGGTVDVSMLDASLYLEAPVGDRAAVAIAGRRSYVDAILLAAVPEDAPVNLVTAPVYYDYQVIASWRPSPAHRLRLFGFGSDDRAELLFQEPEEIDIALEGGSTSLAAGFQRVSLQYQYAPGVRFKNVLTVAAGRDTQQGEVAGTFHFDSERELVQVRDVATVVATDRLELSFGTDNLFEVANVEVLAPRPPREGDGPTMPNLENQIYSRIEDLFRGQYAVFAEALIRLGRLELIPGVRLDYFDPVEELGFDPRIVARYAISDQLVAKGGVARVHQMPSGPLGVADLTESFGNPDLGLIVGTQYSAGLELRPRDHLRFDVTGFYKDLDDLVSPTTATVMRDGEIVPQVYDNGGTGKVVGLELFAEHRFANNFRGWLSYTLSSARRTDSGAMEDRPFSFDQTHILNLAGTYQLPRGWEVGMRWRLISGNPVTPIVGAGFDSDADEYQGVPGTSNSDRLPTFHQLDLRVDKRWVYDDWILGAYLSLNNATNSQNVEGQSYNFDFTESSTTTGLPLFPIFGVKAEF